MTKTLLTLALGAMALTAQADYSEYFKVVYNNTEYPSESTIAVTEPKHETIGVLEFYNYHPYVYLINKKDTPQPVFFAMEYLDPTKEMIDADPSKWGVPQICFFNAMVVKEDGSTTLQSNCCGGGTNQIVGSADLFCIPPAGQDVFYLGPEATKVASAETVIKYRLRVVALDEDREEIPGATYTATLLYGPEGAGVAGVGADNAPAVYYNLQGVETANPEHGIFIERRGGKSVKVVK